MKNIESYLAEILDIPLAEVAKCGTFFSIVKVSKGAILLQEGEVCKYTFFVESGLLRMYSIDRNGKEHIIQFAPEKWLISDRSSLYFNEKSRYYIDAVEDSEVLQLQSDFFANIQKKFPNSIISNNVLLQKHIRNLQNRVHSLLAQTAEERYLHFIKM